MTINEITIDEMDIRISEKRAHLQILPEEKKTLSKTQQVFNKLITRIEYLQKQKVEKSNHLEKILAAYSSKIPALKKTAATSQLNLAKTIGAAIESAKYGKRQLENIRAVIIDLCDESFAFIEPDKETEAFYDKWSETTYQEDIADQSKIIKQELADQFKFFAGIDVNPDDYDNSPEGFEKMKEKFNQEFEKRNTEEKQFSGKKKKTKKQLEREERQKHEETVKLKSLRNIYVSLAKILHPDKETDASKKNAKEELMKKVIEAYNKRDLPTLLKLELQWISSSGNNLEALTDDKLKLYIASLKEQVYELENEHSRLSLQPRFTSIFEFSDYSEHQALHFINREASVLKQKIKILNQTLRGFSESNSKKKILQFVEEYVEILDADDQYHDDFFCTD